MLPGVFPCRLWCFLSSRCFVLPCRRCLSLPHRWFLWPGVFCCRVECFTLLRLHESLCWYDDMCAPCRRDWFGATKLQAYMERSRGFGRGRDASWPNIWLMQERSRLAERMASAAPSLRLRRVLHVTSGARAPPSPGGGVRGRVGRERMGRRTPCGRPRQSGPAGAKCMAKRPAALRRLAISGGSGGDNMQTSVWVLTCRT